jgi:hypothetical protein
MSTPTDQFRAARDFLLAHRTDYETAYAKFSWPRPATFNFAVDWFDAVLAAEHPDRGALRLIEEDGRDAGYTFAELSARSARLARAGSRPGRAGRARSASTASRLAAQRAAPQGRNMTEMPG